MRVADGADVTLYRTIDLASRLCFFQGEGALFFIMQPSVFTAWSMAHFTANAYQFRGGSQIDKTTFLLVANGVAFQALTIAGVVLVGFQRGPLFFQFLYTRLEGLKGLAVRA